MIREMHYNKTFGEQEALSPSVIARVTSFVVRVPCLAVTFKNERVFGDVRVDCVVAKSFLGDNVKPSVVEKHQHNSLGAALQVGKSTLGMQSRGNLRALLSILRGAKACNLYSATFWAHVMRFSSKCISYCHSVTRNTRISIFRKALIPIFLGLTRTRLMSLTGAI